MNATITDDFCPDLTPEWLDLDTTLAERPCVECEQPTKWGLVDETGDGESGPRVFAVNVHPLCAAASDWLETPPQMRTPEYQAYLREMAETEERLAAEPPVKGHRAVAFNAMCDGPCQSVKPVLYDVTGYTIGHAGHPGAELSSFGICAEDLR